MSQPILVATLHPCKLECGMQQTVSQSHQPWSDAAVEETRITGLRDSWQG
jgi:hypothetical protein